MRPTGQETLSCIDDNERSRTLNAACYILTLLENTTRRSQNMGPFDFDNINALELIINRHVAFIEGEGITCEEAHDHYLQSMLSSGWMLGNDEDLNGKRMPDLMPFSNLSIEQKEIIAHRQSLVVSILQFIRIFKLDIESALIDDIQRFSPIPYATNAPRDH